MFNFEYGGIAFIANAVILTYILRRFRDNHRRTTDRSLLAFLVFMIGGFALYSISGSVASPSLLRAAGVMFSAALLADLTGIVLAFIRVVQARRAVLRVRK